MKNKSYKVVVLVLTCFLLYGGASAVALIFDFSWEPFQKVNLVSDIFKSNQKALEGKNIDNHNENAVVVNETQQQDFSLYQKPELITNFYVGDTISALPQFAEKLRVLKETGKGKIRIAYLGDSMIEGDLMTQTLRELLQKEFGGEGVGFLPISSKVAGFRQTANITASGWKDSSFMTKGVGNVYLSGHTFSGTGSGSYRDNTAKDSLNLEKSLIFGKVNGGKLSFDGQDIVLNGIQLVNRKILKNDISKQIKIKSHSDKMPLYGVSFESENGVFVDNFSFRGITGVELKKIDENFLKAIQEANQYDLIVLQYGVNLLFRPKDKDYTYYEKAMLPILEKLKSTFSGADFLLISTADRAFRYNGEYQTAIGIPNLIEIQARLALNSGFSFYNQFESMGGTNSIVRWAKKTPALANKDYIHPNHKGAEILAEKLFNAMMRDYKKLQPKNKVSQ